MTNNPPTTPKAIQQNLGNTTQVLPLAQDSCTTVAAVLGWGTADSPSLSGLGVLHCGEVSGRGASGKGGDKTYMAKSPL